MYSALLEQENYALLDRVLCLREFAANRCDKCGSPSPYFLTSQPNISRYENNSTQLHFHCAAN